MTEPQAARPSMRSVVDALRTTQPQSPQIGPTDGEADVADALELIEQLHAPTHDEPDTDGHWGSCTSCPDQAWPCPIWVDYEQLAVQWLGRAADRVTGVSGPRREQVPLQWTRSADGPADDHDELDDLDTDGGRSELMRRRYPPTGIPELWVEFGPDGPPPGYGDARAETTGRTA